MNDDKTFVTVRVVFAKRGRARYISHLDLNRTMIRALRRAALPIWYTEGFNRHPYVTFAAPLSLGYESERETMDVRLIQPVPMGELVQRLGAVMPQGLTILSAASAVHKPGEVAQARYRLTLDCPAAAVRDLLASPSVTAEKRTKKKQWKTVELQPALAASGSLVSEAEQGTVWELTLPCGGEEAVNPSLLLAALAARCGGEAPACRVVRLAVQTADGAAFV